MSITFGDLVKRAILEGRLDGMMTVADGRPSLVFDSIVVRKGDAPGTIQFDLYGFGQHLCTVGERTVCFEAGETLTLSGIRGTTGIEVSF